jgi:hypothetical protein
MKRYWLLAVIAAGLWASLASPATGSTFLSLGAAADYTVLGIGGDVSIQSDMALYQSDTVINGNVGQGPRMNLDHGIDATVNGRWDYDLTDSNPAASGYTGNVSGGFHQIDMNPAVNAARSASNAAAAFAPTQMFSSLQNGQVIVGTAGLNVIRITGNSTIKTSLTISGTSSSTFIFQFVSNAAPGKSVLTLSGMTMNLLGGVQPDNIYWNFNGKGGDVNINSMASNQIVYGNFLAPDRNIYVDHGNILGRVIGGGRGSTLNIHGASKITGPPPASP